MSDYTENVTVTNETVTGVTRGFTVHSKATNDATTRLNKGIAIDVKVINEQSIMVRKGTSVTVSVSSNPSAGFANKTDTRAIALSAVTVTGEAAKSVIVGEAPVINAIRIIQYRRDCRAISLASIGVSSSDGRIGNSKFYR